MTHFVALITDDFHHDGGWPDQEIGYAFAKSKVETIFVKLSHVVPKGLAGFKQAVSVYGGSNPANIAKAHSR